MPLVAKPSNEIRVSFFCFINCINPSRELNCCDIYSSLYKNLMSTVTILQHRYVFFLNSKTSALLHVFFERIALLQLEVGFKICW